MQQVENQVVSVSIPSPQISHGIEELGTSGTEVSRAKICLDSVILTGCGGDGEIVVNDAAHGVPAMSASEDLGGVKACAYASDEDDIGEQHGAVLAVVWSLKGRFELLKSSLLV